MQKELNNYFKEKVLPKTGIDDDYMQDLMEVYKKSNYKNLKNLDGNLYLAKNVKKNKTVILKFFDTFKDESFFNEVRGLLSVSKYCENFYLCINSFGSSASNDFLYIDFEYIENLKKPLKTTRNKYIIAVQLLRNIAILHKNRMAHLDIKPDNVIIDKEYRPKIIDFDAFCLSSDKRCPKIFNPPRYSLDRLGKGFKHKVIGDVYATLMIIQDMLPKNDRLIKSIWEKFFSAIPSNIDKTNLNTLLTKFINLSKTSIKMFLQELDIPVKNLDTIHKNVTKK